MRADGKKMGKSEKGAIFLDKNLCSVYDFYQYWRNVPDADVIKFMKLFTFMSLDEIAEYDDPARNINEAKERLAFEQTKIIHGEEEAEKARQAARALFAGAGTGREGIPTVEISQDELNEGIGLLSAFVLASFCKSNSEARTIVMQGGAEVNGEKVTDVKRRLTADDLDDKGEIMLKAGKKKFCRLIVK